MTLLPTLTPTTPVPSANMIGLKWACQVWPWIHRSQSLPTAQHAPQGPLTTSSYTDGTDISSCCSQQKGNRKYEKERITHIPTSLPWPHQAERALHIAAALLCIVLHTYIKEIALSIKLFSACGLLVHKIFLWICTHFWFPIFILCPLQHMVYYPTSCGVAEEAVFVVYCKTVKKIVDVN